MNDAIKGIGLIGLGAGLLSISVAGMFKAERPAVPARLIGLCDGRILAAEEESAFPAGCTWIEPIRYASERLEREDSPDHSHD